MQLQGGSTLRELCQSHNLALAPDGKCILCRRPALARFVVRPETEDALSSIVTAVLGVCLVTALGALVYAWRLDPQFAQGGAADGSRWTEIAVESSPSEPSKAEAQAPRRTNEATTTTTARAPARSTHGPLPPIARDDARADSVRIVMYRAPWCYVCDRARDFLGADVVDLVELDVESSPAALRALTARNPMQTLPTFVIRGAVIVGFSPYDLEQAVREALAPAPSASGLLAAAADPPPEAP
jgi:glutaredoxin